MGDKKYLSIADCERCKRIPQKMAEDVEPEGLKIIPPEVNELSTIIELDDESTHRYCTSTTRLLKCPACGSYYYYNHYDDEGEYFMDPPSNTITVRRYDPLTAIDFLEHILAGPEGALPHAFGQLTKAFVEGGNLPSTQIAQDLGARLETVREELNELGGRYAGLVRELGEIIQRSPVDWHIQMYAIESLFNDFALRNDWDSLSGVLLHHADPAVRVATAKLVIGIGTGDAPVLDILHATGQLRGFLEVEVAKKDRMDELVAVLLELALTDSGTTLEYDHGYGNSRYNQASIRKIALYYLVVAAGHRARMLHAIPALVGLLSPDKWLNSQVCWVLRTLAEKSKKGAQGVLDELDKLRASKRATKKIFGDDNVEQLIQLCQKRLAKK